MKVQSCFSETPEVSVKGVQACKITFGELFVQQIALHIASAGVIMFCIQIVYSANLPELEVVCSMP
jgi:hypothetical protein